MNKKYNEAEKQETLTRYNNGESVAEIKVEICSFSAKRNVHAQRVCLNSSTWMINYCGGNYEQHSKMREQNC